MSHPSQNAIQAMSHGYADKLSLLNSARKQLGEELRSAKNPAVRIDINNRLSASKNSKLFDLYRHLKKNSDTVLESAGTEYPTAAPKIGYRYDAAAKRHVFTDGGGNEMKNTSNVFNDIFPTLHTLATRVPTRQVKEGGKVITTSPCFLTHGNGETETDYLSAKPSEESMRHIDAPVVDQDTLEHCKEPQCLDCYDCSPHQDELINHLNGLMNNDSTDSDGKRGVHFKNLLTTMTSWKNHELSRGHDEASCNDKAYSRDAESHAKLASNLMTNEDRLHRALEHDYFTSGGKGGVIHRDHFGAGTNSERY